MDTRKTKNKLNFNFESMLYYFGAFALPNIFLFNIYNQNRESVQILVSYVFIAALIFGSLSFIIAFIINKIIRSHFGGVAIILLFWLGFWFFERLLSELPDLLRITVSVIYLLALLFLASIAKSLNTKFEKLKIVANMVAGIISLLFVFNFVPAITFTSVANRDFSIRSQFYVNRGLPSPDVYFILMDGMLNFDSMQTFFDMPQTEFINDLQERGFLINKDAEYVAYNTYFGVPGLLSPDFYDSFLHDLFMEGRELLRWDRSSLLFDALDEADISFATDIAPYHEIFHAFIQAGYRATMIADFDPNVYLPIDQFYYVGLTAVDGESEMFTSGNLNNRLFNALNLIELLTLMTPIPGSVVNNIRTQGDAWYTIPEHNEYVDRLTQNSNNLRQERQIFRSLIDTFEVTEPQFVYIAADFTHPSGWHWQDYELMHSDEWHFFDSRIDWYLLAHVYATDFLIRTIDLILERNPGAVIVIQSDHGFHTEGTQRTLISTGFTQEEVISLHNSVMSAVRIPEIYGGLDEPLDPRNITRELVNRFVGLNYELLID